MQASITATTGQPQQNDKRLMIRDNRDGTYSVAFELSNPGSHQFHISIARESVHGSPYVIPLQPFFAPAPPIIRSHKQAEISNECTYTSVLTVPQTLSLQIMLMRKSSLQKTKESVKLTLLLFVTLLQAWVTTVIV